MAAPQAVAAPLPGGPAATAPLSADCPAGYLGVLANATFVGVAVPGKVEEQPGSGALPGKSMDGSTSETHVDEVVGTGCVRRRGDEATMLFSWRSIGRVHSGTFVYQLYDCTTGQTSDALTRHLGYQQHAVTSGSATAIVAVDPSHTYRMRITGEGSYARRSDGFTGVLGYWSVRPPAGSPAWTGTTPCA